MDMLPVRSDEGLWKQATGARRGRSAPANLREQVDPVANDIYRKCADWPTARTSDAEGGPIQTEITDDGFRSYREKSGQWFGAKLRDAAETHEKQDWPSPRAGNPGSRPNGKGGKILAEEARKQEQWATPQARDFKSGRGKEQRQYKESAPMVERDADWGTPSVTTTGGPTGLGGGSGNKKKMNALGDEGRAMCTGKLNPRWVETLMGVPIGWVSPEPVTHTTCTNRTDELRLLGNGVVPQTCAIAVETLREKLCC